MFGIPLNTIFAVACVVIGLAILFRSSLAGPASSLYGWFSKSTPAKPDRVAAMKAFDEAFAYLEQIKCQDGMTAMTAVLPHFYHSPEPHA